MAMTDVFRILVVGDEGSGKSTLITTLLQAHGAPSKLKVKMAEGGWRDVEEHPGGGATARLRRYRYVVEANENRPLKTIFEVIDTPGFGTRVTDANSFLSRLETLERGHKDFLGRESTSKEDARVHLCLHLLPPTMRPLREVDKRVMQELQRYVPVIPIIAKADTLDGDSLASFQANLRKEFENLGFVPFTDKTEFLLNLQASPLAVIGSGKAYKRVENEDGWVACSMTDEGAKLGRLYNWGLAPCEGSQLPKLIEIIAQARDAIVKQVDRCTKRWSEGRQLYINALADVFASVDRYEEEMEVYTKALEERKLVRPMSLGILKPRYEALNLPQPQLVFGSRPGTPQNTVDAAKAFDKLFQKAFTMTEKDLASIVAFSNGEGTQKPRLLLLGLYTQRTVEFMKHVEHPRYGKYDEQMREAMTKVVSNGNIAEYLDRVVLTMLDTKARAPNNAPTSCFSSIC